LVVVVPLCCREEHKKVTDNLKAVRVCIQLNRCIIKR
jgi:hypothetical protein